MGDRGAELAENWEESETQRSIAAKLRNRRIRPEYKELSRVEKRAPNWDGGFTKREDAAGRQDGLEHVNLPSLGVYPAMQWDVLTNLFKLVLS
ncbi:hypothetical protein RB213_013694 [Colletotrichum asianum]